MSKVVDLAEWAKAKRREATAEEAEAIDAAEKTLMNVLRVLHDLFAKYPDLEPTLDSWLRRRRTTPPDLP